MRYIDDRDGERLAALFDERGVMQLAGTVFAGRTELRAMFPSSDERKPWTTPGELLKHPASSHLSSNPIIDTDADTATAETDMVTLARDADGRATIKLVARYRDRLRRGENGQWLITNRTGISLARPGEEGTDAEWARALAAMPDAKRARFQFDQPAGQDGI
jgi:hypothetical protein